MLKQCIRVIYNNQPKQAITDKLTVEKAFDEEPDKVKKLVKFLVTSQMQMFDELLVGLPGISAETRRRSEWHVSSKEISSQAYAGTWPPKKQRVRNYRATPLRTANLIEPRNNHGLTKFNSLHRLKEASPEEAEEEGLELPEEIEKSLQHILAELIKTEENYVEYLRIGIEKYGNMFQRKDLPTGLQGMKFDLFANIEAIYEFHRDDFLPMLHRNRRDLKRLFEEFQSFIEKNDFYGYVMYTMHQRSSLQIRSAHKNYFLFLQDELDDDLGINSFLVQPIQRLGRYPLLLKEFINTLLKKNINAKPILEACGHLDTTLRKLLNTANESDVVNDIADLDKVKVFSQGSFRKVSEFNVYDHSQKRCYRSKVFIFDKCIFYTEVKRKSKSLICHGLYFCDQVGCSANMTSFKLFSMRRKQQECVFHASPAQITEWLELMRDIANCVDVDSSSSSSDSESDEERTISCTTWYY